MLPKAICEEPKNAAIKELRSSGAEVTDATKTAPTTTLWRFILAASLAAEWITFSEPRYRSNALAMKAITLNSRVITFFLRNFRDQYINLSLEQKALRQRKLNMFCSKHNRNCHKWFKKEKMNDCLKTFKTLGTRLNTENLIIHIMSLSATIRPINSTINLLCP